MRDILLFCEDSFHEKFIGALLRRFEEEQGGLPRMHAEFSNFLRDLARDRRPLPDAVIAVADANVLPGK
jgi:hypothetical protein